MSSEEDTESSSNSDSDSEEIHKIKLKKDVKQKDKEKDRKLAKKRKVVELASELEDTSVDSLSSYELEKRKVKKRKETKVKSQPKTYKDELKPGDQDLPLSEAHFDQLMTLLR